MTEKDTQFKYYSARNVSTNRNTSTNADTIHMTSFPVHRTPSVTTQMGDKTELVCNGVHNIQSLARTFANQFPIIVKVRRGCQQFGLTEGQILQIYDIRVQKRIKATDDEGQSFSIPLDLSLNVRQPGCVQPLAQVIDETKLPQRVRIENLPTDVDPHLTVNSVYGSYFALANAIENGFLERKLIQIHDEFQVEFSVAVGLSDANSDEWNDYRGMFSRTARSRLPHHQLMAGYNGVFHVNGDGQTAPAVQFDVINELPRRVNVGQYILPRSSTGQLVSEHTSSRRPLKPSSIYQSLDSLDLSSQSAPPWPPSCTLSRQLPGRSSCRLLPSDQMSATDEKKRSAGGVRHDVGRLVAETSLTTDTNRDFAVQVCLPAASRTHTTAAMSFPPKNFPRMGKRTPMLSDRKLSVDAPRHDSSIGGSLPCLQQINTGRSVGMTSSIGSVTSSTKSHVHFDRNVTDTLTNLSDEGEWSVDEGYSTTISQSSAQPSRNISPVFF